MFHYFNALQLKTGLAGYYCRLIDADGGIVTMSADASGTPIATVSGVANMAIADAAGNFSFYVEPGTYHQDIYGTDATTFIVRIPSVPMGSADGTSLDFLQSGTGAVARTVDSKLKDAVSVKDFGAVGDGVVDDTAAILAALTALESGQYEAARGLFFPGGIYRTTATITLTVANVPFKIYSDTRATIFPDMADGAWTFDIDFATGATANFLTFDMENITINDTTSPQQVKNGIRMQRVIGSKFTRCEFNNLNVAVDMGNDSNCNTFDTCMWRGNVKGWKSTAGVANNNVFQNCQWRYHTGTAFDSTGTDGNIIRGGDFEPQNASPVIIASSLRMEAVRFERNTVNALPGITVLSDNKLDVTAYSDGSSQVLPLYDIQGSNNECSSKSGSGGQVAIVRAGAKRNVTTIGYFEQMQTGGGAIYSCADAEATNVLNVGGSFQANGKIAIIEAFKDQLVPADLTTWTATNCTVADLGSGGYRVTITGASPSLSYTPAAGSYSNINVAVTATSSVAASQPIMHITGGTDPSFALSNGWPANVAARKVLATMAGNTFTNPVFTIVPTTPTNATTYDIYNLRSAQTYVPQ